MVNKLTPILASIHSEISQISWPELTTTETRTLAVLGVLVLLFVLEAHRAHRHSPARTSRQSYETNLGVLVLNDALMSVLSVASLLPLAERFAGHGLLSGVSEPWLKALVSFLLLDLTLYLWHRANHRFEFLWMFHKAHHSDRCMNVSTAFRLHGVEVALTTLIKALFVAVIGIDVELLLINEALITLCVMFHHANLSFPGERLLSRVLIVPGLHRTHHSARRSEHDSNYGFALSLWDRLFRSFKDLEPAALGLPYVPSMNIVELFHYGLSRSTAPQARALQHKIAEAAYYKAEKRGFAPGDDMLDWLDAEREVLDRPTPRKRGLRDIFAGWFGHGHGARDRRLDTAGCTR